MTAATRDLSLCLLRLSPAGGDDVTCQRKTGLRPDLAAAASVLN